VAWLRLAWLPLRSGRALTHKSTVGQLGLFHGKTKQDGNNVPFSKNKTRRSWLPNIQSKCLYSAALGEMMRVKVSTRALKTLRKVRRSFVVYHITSRRMYLVQHGGIDQYVLNTKSDFTRLGGHATTRRNAFLTDLRLDMLTQTRRYAFTDSLKTASFSSDLEKASTSRPPTTSHSLHRIVGGRSRPSAR
jgi:large subunit ribosomal protein L28